MSAVVESLIERGRADGRLCAHRVQAGTHDDGDSDDGHGAAEAPVSSRAVPHPKASLIDGTVPNGRPADPATALRQSVADTGGTDDTPADPDGTPDTPLRVSAFEATPDPLKATLVDNGLMAFYPHQARAITAVRDGDNVVVATPTASGKSLAYQVPALERALEDDRHTLYIAPQRALINDQEETLREYAQDVRKLSGPDATNVQVAQYTGQLSTSERRYVRSQQPQVLLATPDMVNYSLLPYAGQLWHWFFSNLDLLVIDEVHRYRGVFGSHVSHVLRRLRRVCAHFDAAPQLVCTSATIGNPTRHPAMVTGAPPDTFEAITTDTAPRGPTHWLFWQPAEKDAGASQAASGTDSHATQDAGERRSSHTEAAHVAAALVASGLQTVVFTRARQTAEQYAQHTARLLRDRDQDALAERVAAYQAALSKSQRHRIEDGLYEGSLRAVWSTNALELGVDIGNLDAIVLDGYPGTRMETRQQAGRAGRNGDPSLVVLVGGDDPLDRYVLEHPDGLLDQPPEGAFINPMNSEILDQHLPAAAVEHPLAPRDAAFFTDAFPDRVDALTDADVLNRTVTNGGVRWNAPQPLADTAPGVTQADDAHLNSAADTDTDGDEAADTDADGTDTDADDDGDGTGDGNEDVESPQHAIDLRTITDRTLTLVDARSSTDTDGAETLGELAFPDGLRDAHPGAIYFHQGDRYVVTEFDADADVARLAPTDAGYTTMPERETSVAVDRVLDERPLSGAAETIAQLCAVTVTDQVIGYRRLSGSGSPSAPIPLDLPATTLETQAVAITVPPALVKQLRRQAPARAAADGGDTADADVPPEARALQGLAHALARLAPLELLCDRTDLASVAVPHHSDTEAPTLFLYDTSPGGVGLAHGSFTQVEQLLAAAHDRITTCGCDDGCPACVHQPHQAQANIIVDKDRAATLAAGLVE